MTSFSTLANEILNEIGSYISSSSDQYSLMCSCRRLHWPMARILYRHISVSDYKARQFFKTISETESGYEYFIKTLEYRASTNTDVHLTHVLLQDAIPRLHNIESLSLFIRSSLSPFLIYILKRSVYTNR